jgi:hypothetical protein
VFKLKRGLRSSLNTLKSLGNGPYNYKIGIRQEATWYRPLITISRLLNKKQGLGIYKELKDIKIK